MSSSLIIDCHTHAYPDEVVKDPRSWAQARCEYHWAELVSPEDRKSIQGWATLTGMLESMDRAGVDRAVLLGWYWEHESTCRWHNQLMSEWIKECPDRLLGFAAIYPNENVIDQLELAADLGFCGVGELHIGVQKFDASSPYWSAMADWCVAQKWPINFHVTEAAGHDHPGSVPSPLQSFVQLARSAPELKMILAHWGGGLPFFEQNPKIRETLKNVYYDVAASPLLYDIDIFQRMVNLVGADKILFGSDYPLRVYPRNQKTPDMEMYIQEIQKESGLSDNELDRIFGRNFAHLIESK